MDDVLPLFMTVSGAHRECKEALSRLGRYRRDVRSITLTRATAQQFIQELVLIQEFADKVSSEARARIYELEHDYKLGHEDHADTSTTTTTTTSLSE